MNDNKTGAARKLRAAASLILIGLYAAGLVCMFANAFQTGLILWVISTLGGIGLLYWIRTMERRAEDAAKRELAAKARAEGDGEA